MAGGADQFDTVFGEATLELGRGVSLVSEDRLTVPTVEQEDGLEQSMAHVRSSTFGLATGRRSAARRCATQLQSQSPEVSGLRRGSTRPAQPQFERCGSGAGAAALDGGRVDQPGVAAPPVSSASSRASPQLHPRLAQRVVPGLTRQ